MHRRIAFLLWMCCCALLAGCAAPQGAPPTPTSAPITATVAAALPAPTPTQHNVASPTPIGRSLPAPVYLIEAESGQVVRLEADGATQTQITFEATPVHELSVSENGGIVYVVGAAPEQVLVSLDGSGRRELAQGTISAPQVSPDGQQVVYRLDDPAPGLIIGADASPNGVWIQSTSGMRPSLLRADDAELDTWDPADPAWVYVPVAWSPIGDRVALFAYDADGPAIPGGELVIRDPAGVQAEVRGPSCCEVERWSADGRFLTMAGGGPGPDLRYGLYRFDAATGVETAILEVDDATVPLVTGAQYLADGALYAFVEQVPGPVVDWEYAFKPALARVDVGGVTPLRPADLTPYETLWEAQGRGALITFEPEFTTLDAYAGRLAWLATGAPAWELPLRGSQVQWIPATPLASGDCNLFTPRAFQEDAVRRFDANVRDLQARLNAQSFDAGAIDGLFGAQTRTGLEQFQAARGLPVTGVLDCASWQALLAG